MQLTRTLAVLAAMLAPLAAAGIVPGQETCYTHYGSQSVQLVPTQTTRQTMHLTLVSTTTQYPLTTVTPTSTVTADSIAIDTITLAQKTDTITSTATAVATSTVVVNLSVTDTVESTSTIITPPTVTASTAANFTPFASEAAVIAAGGGTGPSKKRREAPRLPRRGLDDLAARGQAPIRRKLAGAAQRYPKSVKCVVYVEHIATQTTTVTAPKTRTQTAPVFITTSTSVETITSTIVPGDASATVTSTSTATSITVVVNLDVTTVSSTTTSTSFAGATVTYYPQCQSNNLITYVGGVPLYYLNSGGTSYVDGTSPNAVTCCQTCANTPGCSGFSGPSPGYSDCYIFSDQGTCDASIAYWSVTAGGAVNSDYDVVGNGNCGQGAYGGTS